MRLSLIFIMLILLPVATGLHAWLFCDENLPRLTQETLARLKEAGVNDPVVDIRFFDIAVAGEAPDPPSREQALAAIRSLQPLRLLPEADRLHVVARLDADVTGNTLHLRGWLPEGDDKNALTGMLSELRPDLRMNTEKLMTAAVVRWPEGFKPPLTVDSPMVRPIVEKLRVPAELRIEAKGDSLVLSGLLPDEDLKQEIVAALVQIAGGREVDPSGLKASPHVQTAPFAVREHLAAFVGDFFRPPPPRSFHVGEDGVPHLTGLATRQMESRWLSLLRPVTGAARVQTDLESVSSELHFPDYKIQSDLPEEQLTIIRSALKDCEITFDEGSSRLSADGQIRLTSLIPVLLSAGPALRLVIGAYPDPAGPEASEKAIGKARAQAVLSFLIDQGIPSSDISAVVFDPVPAGSSTAPSSPRMVEIMIK
ncbi:MAG: OmpA family protein [Prosthecobacter sp.]